MSTMRIAIAGTCGLARAIAREIHDQTSHQLLILSRNPPADLVAQGYQCQAIDYNTPASIHHALLGVDTVISTVAGTPQLRLIEAAVACKVRRFAPAEFEGRPALRAQNDPLDRGKGPALALLQHYRAYIQSTVFVCGVFYERFSVHGLSSHRIGVNLGFSSEGRYIADLRNMLAEAPLYTSSTSERLTALCLTSVYDVGRFVVKALDMDQWPAELSMCGERMTVHQLIATIEQCRGRPWNDVQWDTPDTLRHKLTIAQMGGDVPEQRRLYALIATAEGRYDFASPGNLNLAFPEVQPVRFAPWLTNNWMGVP